jgi:hypothetical protein
MSIKIPKRINAGPWQSPDGDKSTPSLEKAWEFFEKGKPYVLDKEQPLIL